MYSNALFELQQCLPFTVLKPLSRIPRILFSFMLQQYLFFTVGAAECEAAKEQSDNEAYTLQAFEQSEGKTKVIKE